MNYTPHLMPLKHRALPGGAVVATAVTGDFAIFSPAEFALLTTAPAQLPLHRQADLRSRFILGAETPSRGIRRLIASRVAARHETLAGGPALHIIVPTLQCAHSCRYCQVSRALNDQGHTMSPAALDASCDAVFESQAPALTVEFQGGDPLLRFDLVQRAILRIAERNRVEQRRIRYVIACTLHQLDEEMCAFFKTHGVFLSTSLDGPRELHNRNRPVPGRNAYERTLAGIELARKHLGADAVSALMTTTQASLAQPDAIVDEYVRLGFKEIFLRPLSSYGFAKRNQALLGYSVADFIAFYQRALDRILHWNAQGVELREVYASILLNKILSPFDAGYVDLQSPTGAGSSVLVYNYDGHVYPSDEARMLAETGDLSLRMGPIGTPLSTLLASPVRRKLAQASEVETAAGCQACPYSRYCAPNPVDAQAQWSTMHVAPPRTEHCQRHLTLFDVMFERLQAAQPEQLDMFHRWARPVGAGDI